MFLRSLPYTCISTVGRSVKLSIWCISSVSGISRVISPGLNSGPPVLFQLGISVFGAIVHPPETGLGEGVVQDADHPPGSVVMGAGAVGCSPDHGGYGETALALVQDVRTVVGPPPFTGRDSELLRDDIGVTDQLLQPGGADIEYFFLIGLPDQAGSPYRG